MGKDDRLGREVVAILKGDGGSYGTKGGLVGRERGRWSQELWQQQGDGISQTCECLEARKTEESQGVWSFGQASDGWIIISK